MQTALVDEEGVQARTYGPGPQSAAVESIADGAIRVRVSSAAGGFLVLSEAFYPGWQGRIDEGIGFLSPELGQEALTAGLVAWCEEQGRGGNGQEQGQGQNGQQAAHATLAGFTCPTVCAAWLTNCFRRRLRRSS